MDDFTYDITPESTARIRQRISQSSDEHLGDMIGMTLRLLRDTEVLALAIEMVKAEGADKLTVDRAQEYNASIMALLMEELNVRVKGSAAHGH